MNADYHWPGYKAGGASSQPTASCGRPNSQQLSLGPAEATRFCHIIFIVLLLFGVGCKQSKPETERVSRIVIYYVEWSLTTFADLSCDDLVGSDSSVTLSETDQITEFLSSLSSARLHELPELDYVDARVCCLIYDTRDNVIKTISFAPTGVMQIDDRAYETDPSLFERVLSYLPEDYLKT